MCSIWQISNNSKRKMYTSSCPWTLGARLKKNLPMCVETDITPSLVTGWTRIGTEFTEQQGSYRHPKNGSGCRDQQLENDNYTLHWIKFLFNYAVPVNQEFWQLAFQYFWRITDFSLFNFSFDFTLTPCPFHSSPKNLLLRKTRY